MGVFLTEEHIFFLKGQVPLPSGFNCGMSLGPIVRTMAPCHALQTGFKNGIGQDSDCGTGMGG